MFVSAKSPKDNRKQMLMSRHNLFKHIKLYFMMLMITKTDPN